MTMGNKIRDLRKENNMTQENLADYLNVSRQSISKWESDESFPETDKLIKIADLFNVSVDYLLRNNDNKDSNNINNDKLVKALDIDINDYNKKYNLTAIMIGLGVFLILNGISLMILLNDIFSSEIGSFTIFFSFLIVSVGLFIFFGMKLDKLAKVPYNLVPNFETEKEKENKRFIIAITIATTFLLAAVLVLVLISLQDLDSTWQVSLFLSMLSLSVFIYVYMGIRVSKYQVKDKKEEKGDYIIGAFAIFATAAFLVWGFMFNGWQVSWIVFPVFILSGVAIKKLVYKE